MNFEEKLEFIIRDISKILKVEETDIIVLDKKCKGTRLSKKWMMHIKADTKHYDCEFSETVFGGTEYKITRKLVCEFVNLNFISKQPYIKQTYDAYENVLISYEDFDKAIAQAYNNLYLFNHKKPYDDEFRLRRDQFKNPVTYDMIFEECYESVLSYLKAELEEQNISLYNINRISPRCVRTILIEKDGKNKDREPFSLDNLKEDVEDVCFDFDPWANGWHEVDAYEYGY